MMCPTLVTYGRTSPNTFRVFPTFPNHFRALPTLRELLRALPIICQPRITIVNSHNYSPHFRLSSYSDMLPVSLQLSGQLLARLCSLQSHDHLPSIGFVSRRTSEPF